ncbi:MAG: hypothetical protein HYY35_10140 [Deltaproteobacteria bacterium]|nr:hypothetical protein [Deltaproteobacteria bacterium]
MTEQPAEPVDPATYASLEPDFILPEQFFYEQQPRWSAEMSLLWAVFSDGIETFRKEVQLGRERGEAFTEALCWIETSDQESIFSFDRLCELFRLTPAKVRKSLLAWRARHHQLATAPRAA